MNPYERWDDWEWENAAREIGRANRNYENPDEEYPGRKYYFNRRYFDFGLGKWTGSQKRVVLAAFLFLTIIFSSRGDDFVSRSVYSMYKFAIQSENYYTALNSMAKEAMGIPEQNALPVGSQAGSQIEEIFYPPVAGTVKVGFQGKTFTGKISQGIEIQSELGTPVLSPEEGVVLEVVENSETGKTIHLNLGNGWEGIIGNFSDVTVSQGDPVYKGMKLGSVGISSARQKPWLYLELIKNGKPVNPLPYLIQNK